MSSAVALALAAIGTFAIRYGSVRLGARRALSIRTTLALRHAAVGVLALLAVGSAPASRTGGAPAASAIAVVVTTVVARRSRSMTATMAAGIGAYALATALWG